MRALLEDSLWPILLATELIPRVQPQEPGLSNHAVFHPCAFPSLEYPTPIFSRLNFPPL